MLHYDRWELEGGEVFETWKQALDGISEPHYDGRRTSNEMQSGCCWEMHVNQSNWFGRRETGQRDRQSGRSWQGGSAERGAQGPRYERRSGPAWCFIETVGSREKLLASISCT